MREDIKSSLYSVIAFLILGLGISLQIKAGIGQSMLNAFAMTLGDLFHLSIGALLNSLNLLFFIAYLIIRRSRLNRRDVIQIVATIANGYIINLFVYNILGGLTVESYTLRVVLFILGVSLAAMSLGAVLAMDIIKFPLESLCIVLGEKFGKDLTDTRMSFDLAFMISTIGIAFFSQSTLYIREGTIISFFLLSRLMGSSYNVFKKHYKEVA